MTAPTEDRPDVPAAERPHEEMGERGAPRRFVAFALLCAAALALAGSYAWRSAARRASFVQDVSLSSIGSLAELDPPPVAGGPAPLPAAPGIVDRPPGRELLVRHTALDGSFGVASVERLGAAGGERRATPLRCDRVDFAGERGVCLTTDRFYTTHSVMVFDSEFAPLHRLPLHGVPSRVRVAPNGRLAAVTVFVSGHSYADEGFSTETSIVDTYSGERRVANLEELEVRRDGVRLRAADFNFWGVTFAADSDRFYATLGTGGAVYLIEGRVSTRQADVVLEGIECPSLSPDQTRIAFKKRVPLAIGFGWRLHVMHLRSHAVTALAELRSVDDQVEWLDDYSRRTRWPSVSARVSSRSRARRCRTSARTSFCTANRMAVRDNHIVHGFAQREARAVGSMHSRRYGTW